MPRLIAFNKPYGVVCQFSPSGQRPTLADFIPARDVYPAGRLDHDSEGLLLLTDDGRLQAAIADPRARMGKRYWCQVEGRVEPAAIEQLSAGVSWGQGLTASALATRLGTDVMLWPRVPPIRERRHKPTDWLEMVIHEGKNRQVRHMTAAVGLPTLRLVRVAIGHLELFPLGLAPGQFCEISPLLLGLERALDSGSRARPARPIALKASGTRRGQPAGGRRR